MFDIKKQLLWSKLKVSLVVTLALSILFITIFFAGSIEKLLSPKVELKAQIQDIKGLRKGAPVWVSGVEVGSVTSIDLHHAYGTLVTLSINRKALDFLKKDSEASILTMGLLGDKYVELHSGSPEAAPIKPGDMIRGTAQIEIKDIMERSAVSIQKMSDFISKLENLVANIEKGEGTVAKFLTDPAIYDNLRVTTETLSSILSGIKTGEGTIRLLLEDPSLYNKMVSATSSLDEFGRRMNEGQGTLRKLTEDPSLYENLNNASIQLALLLDRIDAGEGLASDLIADEQLAQDLKDTVAAIKELTTDIRERPTRYFKFSLF